MKKTRVKCISIRIHFMCVIIIKLRITSFNDLQLQIGKQKSCHAE